MTTTEPTLAEEIEERARIIAAGWVQRDEADRLDRARLVASRQVKNRRRLEAEQDPRHWAPAMAEAGCTSLALTWPGCPARPDACVPPGPWRIDGTGVHRRDGRGSWHFVCSPAVKVADFQVAVLAGKKWVTVDLSPYVEGRTFEYQGALQALGRAGLTLGDPVDLSDRDDQHDRVSAYESVVFFLFGVTPGGSIGHHVVRTLAAAQEDRLAEAASTIGRAEGRQQLGEVLGRLPADVAPGRRSR